jgi:hypothetical protein
MTVNKQFQSQYETHVNNHYQWVPIDKVKFARYQRPTAHAHLSRIVNGFDLALLDPCRLALRDGYYYATDCQHRILALKELGAKEVYAFVEVSQGERQEAERFLRRGQGTRSLGSWELWEAGLIAEDPDALALREVLLRHDFVLTKHPKRRKEIGCIGVLMRLVRKYSVADVERVLLLLLATFPDDRSAYTTDGFWALFFARRELPPTITDRQLSERWRLIGWRGVAMAAVGFRSATNIGQQKALTIALVKAGEQP